MGDEEKPDPLVGKVIAGRYEVLRLVDQGGMGSIYEVAHTALQRRFAVKTLAPILVNAPEALARFQREANVVASLRHPNIVDIVGWEQLDDGSPCIVMEYLEGVDLCTRLGRLGALPWADIARIADEILSALSVTHRAGIVHRDLKPQNIFLSRYDVHDERAKLLDFGISKITHSQTLAQTGAILGTPEYMSPEQAEGHIDQIDAQTDVWAMGAILYEMATGRQAFSASNTPAILRRICDGEPEPLPPLRSDAPEAFVTLISRALSRDPSQRLAGADDMRDQLRDALLPMYLPSPTTGSRSAATPIPACPPETSATHNLATGPTMSADTGGPGTLSVAAGQTLGAPTTVRPPTRRGGRGALLIAGASALGLVSYLALDGSSPSNPDPTTTLNAPAAMPVPATKPARAPDAGAPRATTPATVHPEPEGFSVKISSNPPGARVVRLSDDETLGTTPFRSRMEQSPKDERVRLELDGHLAAEFVLDGQPVQTHHIDLEKTKKATSASKRNRRPKRDQKKQSSHKKKSGRTNILDW